MSLQHRVKRPVWNAVGTGFYLLVFPGDVTAPFQKQIGLFTLFFFFFKGIFSVFFFKVTLHIKNCDVLAQHPPDSRVPQCIRSMRLGASSSAPLSWESSEAS